MSRKLRFVATTLYLSEYLSISGGGGGAVK
jgi:hypothetical protein